jgi:hypothetical protein
MQTNFRQFPVLILALFSIIFISCKKDSKPAESTNELTAHADDQNRVSTQIDAASNDVSVSLESYGAYSGRLQNPPPVFAYDDATATFDSTSNPKKITITYNGSTSSHPSFSRTGTVVVSMASGVRWKDQGAVVTVSYQNLKIKRTIDNKSITINGSHTIINASGGLLIMLPFSSPGQSVTHTIGGSLIITFDDNTQRTWQVATRRVFTFSNNNFVLTITGNNTIGNTEGVTEWGINRFGHEFVTSIKQPLVIRQDCAFRLTSGQIQHEGFGTAVASFGLDANGNPTSCPGTGNYYFKLTWTGPNGATASATLPY